MNRLSFGKRQMIQMKLAILLNDNFRMERLHNQNSVSHILRFDKRGKGGMDVCRLGGTDSVDSITRPVRRSNRNPCGR